MKNKNLLFPIGTEVEVIKEDLQSYGLIGVVVKHPIQYPNSVVVRFDNWDNRGTKELYINKNNLRLKGETKEMSEVKGNYGVVMVKFLQGTNTIKEYAFALFDTSVLIGDCVLCDTANGYNVAKVVNIISKEEYVGEKVTKEIICKVDFSEFEKRKELRKKKENIKKQMDKMVKDNQELVLYQMLAEKNPEMAKMLEEYKQLMTV